MAGFNLGKRFLSENSIMHTGPEAKTTLVPSLVAAALLALGAACSDDRFIKARTYDFFADMSGAEIVSSGAVMAPDGLTGPAHPWTDDERLFYPAPRRTFIRFKNVPIGNNAVLSAGYGLMPGCRRPEKPEKEGCLLFRIEVSAGGKRHKLFEEKIDPFEIEPGKMKSMESRLPDLGAEYADFVFTSDRNANLENIRAAWCSPVLRSDGWKITAEEAAVTFARSCSHLLDSRVFRGENIDTSSFRADYDEENSIFLKSESGRLLMQTAPATAVFDVHVPENACLSFGTAPIGAQKGNDVQIKLAFSVLNDGQEVFRKTVPLSGEAVSRRISIPLESRGQSMNRIELCTSIEDPKSRKDTKAAAVWIHPLIEKRCSAPRQKASDGRNILLLVVDALRADHLSCYGYERDTTPCLDRAAGNNGVIFENVRAQSSWTVPSTATMLTGMYSYAHGLYDAYHWYLVPGITTITQSFLESGMTTTAFIANHLISEDNNFHAGFETYHELPFHTAAQLNRAFLNWLDNHENERFFAYIHYMEPHMPYAAPGSGFNRYGSAAYPEGNRGPAVSDEIIYRFTAHEGPGPPEGKRDEPADRTREPSAAETENINKLLDLYDSEISYWDERFELLVQELSARGLLENTIVVVTSDHGEEFNEHGMFLHGQSLYSELLHVPLIFLNSGHAPGRRSVAAGLIDLAPTLSKLAGLSSAFPGEGPGKEHAAAGCDLFAPGAGHDLLFAETAHGLDRPGNTMVIKRAVISDKWKGIVSLDTGEIELFDLDSDGGETMNLSSSRPEHALKIEALINNWVKECRKTAPYNISLFDASALKKLKEMGYIR